MSTGQMCESVCAPALVDGRRSEGNFGVGPHLPPCLRQGFFVVHHCSLQDSCPVTFMSSPASPSCFAVGTRGFKVRASASDFTWILGIETQILMLVWPAFNARREPALFSPARLHSWHLGSSETACEILLKAAGWHMRKGSSHLLLRIL